MSEFRGTKGPWVADGFDIFSEDMDSHVCIISSWLDEEVEDANANLIAAAPDLLEALQEVVAAIKITLRVGHDRIIELGGECDSPEVMIKGHSEIARAEAAIAKALGQ